MGIGERFEFEKTGRIESEPGTLRERVGRCNFQDQITLTAVKDMLLGEGAADRSNKTLCRAVKRMQAKLRGRAETIRRLEAALDEYEQFADRQSELIRELGRPDVTEMHYTPGKMDIEMRSKLVTIWTECMAEILDCEGAANVVEWTITHREKGPLTLTIQRQFGKTPMQLYAESVRELKAMKAAELVRFLDAEAITVKELRHARPLDEWHEDDGCSLWWLWPVCEPPYAGTPDSSDWPFGDGDEVRWTPIVEPDQETESPASDQTSIL